MRADRLHVAVRPRSILECLDLAFMFCGRRPLAVATAIAIGALPCILINRALLSGPLLEDEFWMPRLYVLGIEAAWASAPLTLYLGQAVFAERFSWWQAARSFVRSLPAMVLFQGLLRSVCIVTLVLVPVVLIAMYYLNQVILLERPKLSKIWSRRGAINQRISGQIVMLVMIDTAILCVGVPVVTGMLGGIASVWQGRPVQWFASNPDKEFVIAMFSWHGQIACWSVCGLLTVFRFFTYLDARIRREGWDVELKLRAPATYAGLSEPASGRFAGAAGWIVMIALASLAGVATAADGGTGANAKRAISRQSFPWYDAPRDSFRSLIQPDREPVPSDDVATRSARGTRTTRRDGASGRMRSGGDAGGGQGTGSGSGGASREPFRLPWSFRFPDLNLAGLGKVLMIGLFVAAALLVIYLVVKHGLPFRSRRSAGDGHDGEVLDDADHERLAALPQGARLTKSDLLSRAEACAADGDFAKAIIYYFAWQLLELDRHGALVLSRGKTNGQYLAEVAREAPPIAGLFRHTSRLFEDAFFGDLPIARADFERVWDERQSIASWVRPKESDAGASRDRGRSRTVSRALLVPLAALVAASIGCERIVESDYAAVRGPSINGVSAFIQLLRDTGHTVTARQYMPDAIDSEHATVVVFDDSFTVLSPAAHEVLSEALESSEPRTLLLVLRDSDCIPDYLRAAIADESLAPDRREKAKDLLVAIEKALAQATSESRPATPPFHDHLAVVNRAPAGEAIDVMVRRRAGSGSRRTIKARWELRRRLAPGSGDSDVTTLWSAADDPLLIRQTHGSTDVLVLASAAPILNGGLVDPGNRLLAEELARLLPTEGSLLLAGSAAVEDDGDSHSGGDDEQDAPSPFRLLMIQPLPWVTAQALMAMALFCWCTSPIFGRPKQSSPTHAQDFGHHVEALASLLAKSPHAARAFVRARLEAWQAATPMAASKQRRRPRS